MLPTKTRTFVSGKVCLLLISASCVVCLMMRLALSLPASFAAYTVVRHKATDADIVRQPHQSPSRYPTPTFVYIAPNEKNCSYINEVFEDLWIEPIEMAVFAMLHTFHALNISAVLYGGTLLSFLRHSRVLPWDKDGDLAFQIPMQYALRLHDFLHHVFQPKLHELYASQNFTCIINTDAAHSVFNCRLSNKPGYVDAFAEYTLYDRAMYDKLQQFIEGDTADTELWKELPQHSKHREHNEPFVWNQHFLDTAIHLQPISILFPPRHALWNRFYADKYYVTQIEIPANPDAVARIFYGDDYMTPPDFTRSEEYGICDRQKHKIELFCFGDWETPKFDRGGSTVSVTQHELDRCQAFNAVFGPYGLDHSPDPYAGEYYEFDLNDQ